MKVFFVGFLKNYPDAYLEPRQTCMMELFVKIVNDVKILTIHKIVWSGRNGYKHYISAVLHQIYVRDLFSSRLCRSVRTWTETFLQVTYCLTTVRWGEVDHRGEVDRN